MRSVKSWYWIVTVLMCLFMTLAAIPDVARTTSAVNLIHDLGYPDYFLRFIGVMKLLGVIAVLFPRFPTLKQWAYAGLVFDTGGALYSHWRSHSTPSNWLPALLGLILVISSYALYTRTHRNGLSVRVS